MRLIWALGLCFLLQVSIGTAPRAELFPMADRASLFAQDTLMPAPRQSPSLFEGEGRGSLFEPVVISLPADAIQRIPGYVGQFHAPTGPVADLRNLIARAEAGSKGYDAVQYGARIKPAADPTRMTIREIYAWIDATPGQPHAIGRYQFIPPTLRRLVRTLGIDPSSRFTPQVQDQLADLLLAEAGIDDFLAGDLKRHAFMNNLAKIWAGLPNHTGKSHYHGYAGNKATMSWAAFDAAMVRIFSG